MYWIRKPLKSTFGCRLLNWLVLFCFYFQTLWPTVVFATEVDTRPVSPTRFFYSPSKPDVMTLDLGVMVDDKDEGFDKIRKSPSLKIPFSESLPEIQELIDDNLSITKLYPGLTVSEQGLAWDHYGYSFFLENNGHLKVKAQAGASYKTSNLRLHNPHGPITIEEAVELSHLRVKGQNVFLKHCRGQINNLSVWAIGIGKTAGREGVVAIDYLSLLGVKKATIHQGTLHNSGKVVVSVNGILDAKNRAIMNYGTLQMEDQSTLRAKEVINQRVQKNATSAPVVGQVKGNGTVTFDVGTFRNLGEVKVSTMQGRIQQLINPGHFEALRAFNNLTIHDLINEGRFKGNGLLGIAGVNRGILEGDELTFTFLNTFVNKGKMTVTRKLSTEGKGAFVQEGKLDLPAAYFNNASFINRSSVDLNQSTWVFGKDVERWHNEDKGSLALQSITFEKPDKEGQVFVNEGTLHAKIFTNRRLFKNQGVLKLGQWHQEVNSFTNSGEGSIEVSDEATFDTDLLDNVGSIVFNGKSKGRIGSLKTNGMWLLKAASKLTGSTLFVGVKGTLKSEDIFDWKGDLLINEGKFFLFDNQIQATRQIINHNLIRWTHNAFKTWHFLNLGWAERSNTFDDPLPTFTVATDKSTTFKKGHVENRGIIKTVPKGYTPRMTVKGGKFSHWANHGSMELKGQNFSAKNFNNTNELIFRGPVTGKIDHFENSGQVFVHDSFKVCGKTFVTSDKFFIESHASFDLTTLDPLQMRGGWKGHGSFSVSAPKIENYGTVANETGVTHLNTSSVVNKAGKLHVASLIFEGEDITNEQGQIQIGQIDRKSKANIPLKVINKRATDEEKRAADKKTTFHVKGGLRLDLINTALLILDAGRYELTGLDNTNGHVEVSVASFDGYTGTDLSLTGTLLIQSLYETKSLKTVFIKGNTTLAEGGFRAQKLHILPRSQLSLGKGQTDSDEIVNQGILRALSSMKVTTRKLNNKDGVIESSTTLKVQGFLESDTVARDTTATPTLLVQSKKQPIKGQKGFGDLILGLLKAKQDLHIHLSSCFDIAESLYKFGEKWQCEGILYLAGSIFRPKQDIEIGRRVQLEVDAYENDHYTLSFHSLRLLAKKFRHGKSHHEMADLKTCAPSDTYDPAHHILEIIVDGDVDNRYGHIHGIGPTIVKSTAGDVLVGTAKVNGQRPICSTYTTGAGVVYGHKDFYEMNGAFVESQETLHMEGNNIKVDYGEVHADRRAILNGRQSISSEGGQFFLQKGATVNTPSFLLKCADAVGHDFSRAVGHRGCNHAGFPSEGAKFLSMGVVRFTTNSLRMISSDFLSLGNVWVNGQLSNENEYFSLERAQGLAGCHCCNWGYKYAPECKFMGGKTVQINARHHQSAGGYLYGQAVELNGETYSLAYLGQAFKPFLKGYVASMLNVARSLIAPGNRGAIQETETDGIAKRYPNRNARILDDKKIAFMGQRNFGLPPGLRSYISPELTPWALEIALAEHLRMLSLPGEVGEIFELLTTQGQQAAQSGRLMSLEDLNSHSKSFIYNDFEEVRPGMNEPILQLYVAFEQRKLINTLQGLVGGRVKANFRGKASLEGGVVQALDDNDTAADPSLQFKAGEIEGRPSTYTEAVAIPGGKRIEEILGSQPTFASRGHGDIRTTEGDFNVTGGQFNLDKGGMIGAEKGKLILLNDALTSKTETKSKKKSRMEESQTLVPTRFGRTSEPIVLFAGDGQPIVLGYTISDALKTLFYTPNGQVQLLLGRQQSSSTSMTRQSNTYWQTVTQSSENHLTYAASVFSGLLEICSRETLLERVRGQSLSFADRLTQRGGSVTYSELDEIHQMVTHRVGGPTAAFAAVIALAATIATSGTGTLLANAAVSATAATGTSALVISTATSAVFASLCSQTALAMVNNQGNPIKAAQSLAKSQTLKNMLTAMATAGLDQAGMGRALAGFTVGVATGQKPEEAALGAIRVAIASTLQASLATHIGAANLDYLTNKLMHAGLGAATGSILSDNVVEGAATGATAAVLAIIAASVISDTPAAIGERAVAKAKADGSPLDRASLSPYVQAELKSTVDYSKLAAAIGTMLAGLDVSVGIDVASTAVVHNCAATMERQVFETSALKEVLGEVAEVVSTAFEVDAGDAAAHDQERREFVESKLKQAESIKGRSLSPTSRSRAEALFNKQFFEYAEYSSQMPFYGAFIPGLEAADGCARGKKTAGQAVGETAFDVGLSFGIGLGVKRVWQGGKWVVQKGAQVAERRAAEKVMRKAPSGASKAVAPDKKAYLLRGSVGADPTSSLLPNPITGSERQLTYKDLKARLLLGSAEVKPTPPLFQNPLIGAERQLAYQGPKASVSRTKIHDYSLRYPAEAENFVGIPKEFDGTLSRPLRVVSYHSDKPIGGGRTLKYWTPVSEAHAMGTMDDVVTKMAILKQYGVRTHVTLAEVPARKPVKFMHGRAALKEAKDGIEIRPGGGVQYCFEKFDEAWIKATKPLP